VFLGGCGRGSDGSFRGKKTVTLLFHRGKKGLPAYCGEKKGRDARLWSRSELIAVLGQKKARHVTFSFEERATLSTSAKVAKGRNGVGPKGDLRFDGREGDRSDNFQNTRGRLPALKFKKGKCPETPRTCKEAVPTSRKKREAGAGRPGWGGGSSVSKFFRKTTAVGNVRH